MFDYINVIYWLIALASLIAWTRFATFMCDDITQNMPDQPEMPWKFGAGGVLLAMLIVYLTMPSFWVALPLNALIAGGMIGAFWHIRVKTMGPSGHLFARAIKQASNISQGVEQRRNAKQVQLQYLRHDNTIMPLPPAQSPLATGLKTADAIVIQALTRRSEIVDLAPAQDGYSLTMTTDGVPATQALPDRGAAESAIQALKVLAGLTVEERRRPQSGMFRSKDNEGNTTVWTVRTSGSVAGERAMISANEKGQWDVGLESLGFNADQLADVKKVASDTQGVVIVTGPRGHGRTATLYALLRQHDAFTNSVQTLEVNPQTEIEGVTVTRFDAKAATESSYPKMLQSVMLKEPNVLLVSHVPDNATADLITRYVGPDASEPHRVYTTLQAQDSFAALEAWLAMNSNKQEASQTLRAIIAQRLVRLLCPTCKIPYQPDEATMKRLNLPVGRNLQSFKANTQPIVDRKGHQITCPDCGGVGYRGRTAIFEVLVINDEIKRALLDGSGVNQIKVLARKNNLLFLIEHGIRKFATGITAIHEVTRVMAPPSGSGPSGKSAGLPTPPG